RLLGRRGRAGEHDRGVRTADGAGDHAGTRGHSVTFADLLVTDQHQRRTVHDAGRVPAGVYVIDFGYLVILLQSDGIEAAHLTDTLEGRLKLGQVLDGGSGTPVLVVVEDGHAVHVPHGHDGLGEVSAGPGRLGLVLRVERETADAPPRGALQRGDPPRAEAPRAAGRVVGGRRG